MKTKTIEQNITFKGVKPEAMYNMYLSPKHHSKITDSQVKVGKKVGDKMSVWEGMVQAKNIHVVSGKMIVQSWYSKDMRKSEEKTMLILYFSKKNRDTALHMTHVHVPSRMAKEMADSWKIYYWQPWKKYLKAM